MAFGSSLNGLRKLDSQISEEIKRFESKNALGVYDGKIAFLKMVRQIVKNKIRKLEEDKHKILEYFERKEKENEELMSIIIKAIEKAKEFIAFIEKSITTLDQTALAMAVRLQREINGTLWQIQEIRSRVQQRTEKIQENELQILQDKQLLKNSCQRVLESDYVEKLRDLCPLVLDQAIREKFRTYFQDPSIKTEKERCDAFAKSLGISGEQLEKVNATSSVFIEESQVQQSYIEDIGKRTQQNQELDAENATDQKEVQKLEAIVESKKELLIEVLPLAADQLGKSVAEVAAEVHEKGGEEFLEDKQTELKNKINEIQERLPGNQAEHASVAKEMGSLKQKITEKDGDIEVAKATGDEEAEKQLMQQKAEMDGQLEGLVKREKELRDQNEKDIAQLKETQEQLKNLVIPNIPIKLSKETEEEPTSNRP